MLKVRQSFVLWKSLRARTLGCICSKAGAHENKKTNLSTPQALFVQELCLMFRICRKAGPPRRNIHLRHSLTALITRSFHWCSWSSAGAWFTHTINPNKNSDYNILSLCFLSLTFPHSVSFSFWLAPRGLHQTNQGWMCAYANSYSITSNVAQYVKFGLVVQTKSPIRVLVWMPMSSEWEVKGLVKMMVWWKTKVTLLCRKLWLH